MNLRCGGSLRRERALPDFLFFHCALLSPGCSSRSIKDTEAADGATRAPCDKAGKTAAPRVEVASAKRHATTTALIVACRWFKNKKSRINTKMWKSPSVITVDNAAHSFQRLTNLGKILTHYSVISVGKGPSESTTTPALLDWSASVQLSHSSTS
jgi:hypothetical protein